MNENINLVDILKDAPRGTKLWSPLCGECEFRGILSSNNVFQIRVKYEEKEGNTTQYLCFSSQGKYCDSFEAECLIFPSKDNRDWSTFKIPRKHKNFELGQKVLVPYYDGSDNKWRLAFYSNYDESSKHHVTACGTDWSDNEILSYKGNENKLGKSVKV